MSKQSTEEIITKIKECAENAAKKHPLSDTVRTSREKEIVELTGLLKHYGILRWAIVSFFMLASFGISGHFLSQEKEKWPLVLAGPGIFLAAILLFWLHSQLISSIQKYLEALGEMLGYYSPKFLKETNVKLWSMIVFLIMFVIYLTGIFFVCFPP